MSQLMMHSLWQPMCKVGANGISTSLIPILLISSIIRIIQLALDRINVGLMTSSLNTCVMNLKDVMEELVPIMNIITQFTSQKSMMVGTSNLKQFTFAMMPLTFVILQIKMKVVIHSGKDSLLLMKPTTTNFTTITYSFPNVTLLPVMPVGLSL